MGDEDFYTDFLNRGGDGEKHPAWSWNEKPAGTVFKGTITDRFTYTDKKKEVKRMAFVVETADGPTTLFVSQWQLERAIAERAPQVGDVLKVRYDGLDSDGQSKKFTVQVEKAAKAAEPDAPKADVPPPSDADFSSEPF